MSQPKNEIFNHYKIPKDSVVYPLGFDRKPLGTTTVKEEWHFTQDDVVTINNSGSKFPGMKKSIGPSYIVRLPRTVMFGGCECNEFLAEQTHIFYDKWPPT